MTIEVRRRFLGHSAQGSIEKVDREVCCRFVKPLSSYFGVSFSSLPLAPSVST